MNKQSEENFLNEMKNYFQGLLAQLEDGKELEEETEKLLHLKNHGGDEGDLATEEREKSMFLRLKAREAFFRKKIHHALWKIQNKTFGECESCGAEISKERLLARPIATLCIHCKEEQEQQEGHIPYKKRSHTMGSEIVNNAS